jgi:hypothetical protein
MPFGPRSQSKPPLTIAEAHRVSAQRNTYMSSVKRNYDRLKEEGEAAVEESSAPKRRKHKSRAEQ